MKSCELSTLSYSCFCINLRRHIAHTYRCRLVASVVRETVPRCDEHPVGGKPRLSRITLLDVIRCRCEKTATCDFPVVDVAVANVCAEICRVRTDAGIIDIEGDEAVSSYLQE